MCRTNQFRNINHSAFKASKEIQLYHLQLQQLSICFKEYEEFRLPVDLQPFSISFFPLKQLNTVDFFVQ